MTQHTPHHNRTTERSRGERGVAVVITALLLIPLMGFAALGVDLASWYSRISFLQKSADAAALAGTVWMPDFTKATAEAKASLQSNGVVDKDEGGTDDIDVVIAVGSKPNSVRVTLTDNSATRFFSQVLFSGNQSLTRSGEAEYNLPIPLGSPLNYFGGDHTKTAQQPVTTYSVAWPADYQSRPPYNQPCNIGTSSSQNLGSWSGDTFNASGHNNSHPQCRWRSSGSALPGTSAVPPPDYTERPPTNGNCRIQEDGLPGGSTLGFWRGNPYRFRPGGGNNPPNTLCLWSNYVTTNVLPDAATEIPANQPCRVGYEAAGAGGGFWSGSVYQVTTPQSVVGGDLALGNILCEWGPRITSTTVTPPNPIDPSRSPGFWAMIEGPSTVSTNGDAYNTRCYIDNNCSSIQNVQHRDSSDPDRGFWYVVKIPNASIGPVDIRVFDASYNPSGNTNTLAGDRSLGSSFAFPTEFRVYTQGNPLDFSLRTPYSGLSSGNQSDGSCYWELRDESSFRGQWRNLCTIASPTPGGTYLVQVQSTGTSGNGVNGYAIEAVAGGSTQPALYAYRDMGMQNNNNGSPPPPATFYLAEVGPQYAGKTLVIDLWDPGDATGNASLFPKKPSGVVPGPVSDVPAADCEYTASPSPSAVQNNSAGGPTGTVHLTPQPSDFSTRCGIRSTISGSRQFNGEWLTIRVAIPASYTCTQGINPELLPGSCWWGIEYNFSSSANDVTTWRARIEGNPVHLIN